MIIRKVSEKRWRCSAVWCNYILFFIEIFLFFCLRFPKELFCSLLTGLLAMPLGVLQFIPLYHPLHDLLLVHSEVCVLLFLSLYVLLVWTADRQPEREARASENKGKGTSLSPAVIFIEFSWIRRKAL